MAAPAWLGIGAQRSGTTWFTDLLCQHPGIGLGANGKKEQHLLHKVGDGVVPATEYLDLFPEDTLARGEWTPQYLRHATAPATAARLLAPSTPVLVILRDPVERFLSAMRLAATRPNNPWPYPVPITVQAFSGCYADQLAMWRHHLGREQMLVMVYEQVRRNPQAALAEAWARLGLEPVPLREVDRPSRSSSGAAWTPPDGLVESLTALYRPQAGRLAEEWGLDLTEWPTATS